MTRESNRPGGAGRPGGPGRGGRGNDREELPVPASLRPLYERTDKATRHPGLVLDKLLKPCPKQEQQKDRIAQVCGAGRFDRELKEDWFPRRRAFLASCSAEEWQRTTQGLLTMHLARASSLENAGICLHPVFGLPYLPGTGLKGMARAFAEAVWRQGKIGDEAAAAEALIEGVFGRASDKKNRKEALSGAIVFHDAWPTTWPVLTPDIVNNHHKDYYAGDAFPIDWDDPNPVSLFAVPAGPEFSFALAPRRKDCPELYLRLARAWLDGALSHLGAGAKTASGYGYFTPQEDAAPDAELTHARVEAHATVELVTPAFLAGADQGKDDCNLRPATLKGLLRWWWRTMYSGLLKKEEMLALEGAIWGDTIAGGAVQVRVDPKAAEPRLFDYKDGFKPKADFARAHCLELPPKNATPGIFYVSYGMDEGGSDRVQRFYIDSGSSWSVRLCARSTLFLPDRKKLKDSKKGAVLVSAEDVLGQARAALWLLCRFGGVGAKARNGFGSLKITGPADWAGMGLQGILDQATRLCEKLGISTSFQEQRAESASLRNMLEPVEHASVWTDPFHALDQIGLAYQGYAKEHKHKEKKLALGLPRKIHGPKREPMRHQNAAEHRPPFPLKLTKHAAKSRYASPMHIHLDRDDQGKLTVRVVAFPSPHLPDMGTSKQVLGEFMSFMDEALKDRCQRKGTPPTAPARSAGPAGRPTQRPGEKRKEDPGRQTRERHGIPSSGATVEAVLLGEKTKKGKWRARHEPTGFEGTIHNSDEVPVEKKPGETVTLIVANVTEGKKSMEFNWPKE